MKIVKFKNSYYKQINYIYKSSFPKEERYLSLNKLISHIKNENAEMYCLLEDEKIYGFLYSIKYENMIFILYLAVDSKNRSSGNGSLLLKWYLEKYSNESIYLNIDEVDKEAEDYDIREKRLNFYLRNGFYLTNYLSCEQDCNFNILSNKKEINIDEYKILDKIVAKILEEPVSNIVEK